MNPMNVKISLDLTRSFQKYLSVTYTFSGVAGPKIVLTFPTWSPGSYLIREYQGHVESFQAKDLKGHKLGHTKLNKCQWQVNVGNKKSFRLTYRVYANDFNVRGAYADQEVVFINPASTFFYLKDIKHIPVRITISKPHLWHIVMAGLARGNNIKFADFETFLDTPILCAQKIHIEKFKVGRTRYTMGFWGEHHGNTKKIAQDTQKIARRQIRMFGDNPCKEYVFQVLFAPKAFGGLEHAHSSSNFFDGALLHNQKDYQRFITLLSHEHFHLWNVKRIRPKELITFDYTREVYTRDLWIAEGITSYYDEHFVYRAGLMSKQQYLSILSENINKLQANKAARVNNISDSSFDAWIRFYRPNENAINAVVSYYVKGGLVMMLLDLLLIRASHGRHTLDEVMRELYRAYKTKPGAGITRDEFIQIAEKFAHKSLKRFFSNYIDGVTAIHWKKEFAPFGIELKKQSKKGINYLGVILVKKEGEIVIQNIAEDSPAYNSMLQPGDEIVAINSICLESPDELDRFLTEHKLYFIISRRKKIYQTSIVLRPKPTPLIELTLKEKLTDRQKKPRERFFRK